MYKIAMRKYWKDGTFTEIDSEDGKTYKDFNEAAMVAFQMDRHIWRFHQDQAPFTTHYVKEI